VHEAVFDSMENAFSHGSTFAPNELAMAAGLATLHELDEQDLVARTARLGARLLELTEPFVDEFEVVREIRGLGLMWAIEFGEPKSGRLSWRMIERMQPGLFAQFVVAPLAIVLTGALGWVGALTALGFLSLAIVPLAWMLRGKHEKDSGVGDVSKTLKQAVRDAWDDPSFLLLTAGFFVCGFHVAFIATHLPNVVALCGLPPAVAGWSLSLIGLFNIAGSFASGWAIGRWRMKSVLSILYAARAAAVLAFMFAPKTASTFMVFAVVLGFTYLSTVPPTVGLVGKLHGMRYVATLFGIVMLSHQVGGFLGAWLGGKAFEATGNYDWMWWADIALCLAAAAVHLPIREARPQPVPAAA